MSDEKSESSGPDFCQGVPASALTDEVPLLGHAQGEPMIVVRRGDELFAIGAVCTHHSGPLAEGLVVGDTVRCPWRHAAFSLQTGEAERDCKISYSRDGKKLAVAVVQRDREGLRSEVEFERALAASA